jgi:hypothetical protein
MTNLGGEMEAIFMAHQDLLCRRVYSEIGYIGTGFAGPNNHDCLIYPELSFGLEFRRMHDLRHMVQSRYGRQVWFSVQA